MSENLCPCCGQPLPGTYVAIGQSAGMSKRETELFLIVAGAGGKPVKWSAIADAIYADDIDGGPMNPDQVVRAIVSRCNHKLRRTNLRILNTWGQGYRLSSVGRVTA